MESKLKGMVAGAAAVVTTAASRITTAAQDTAAAGNGGTATAAANGGAVATGDINSGGNAGNAIAVGDTGGGLVCDKYGKCWHEGGDGSVAVDGGSVSSSTSIGISADGGTAIADASGGDDNFAFIS
jgi:hypothetical protein